MKNMILINGLTGALDSFYLCDHPTTEKEFYEVISPVLQNKDSGKPIVNVSVLDASEYVNKVVA